VEAGNLIAMIPIFSKVSTDVENIWQFFSVIIFFALGTYMLYKAWKKEIILEQRSEINYKKVCAAAMITSLDALFAGLGIGFFGSRLLILAVMIAIITFLFVILGIITGYRLGYEQKTKVYWGGGMILIAAGIDVIIRYL
jgi:putative Mn2+ efflux pump MntP